MTSFRVEREVRRGEYVSVIHVGIVVDQKMLVREKAAQRVDGQDGMRRGEGGRGPASRLGEEDI